MTTIEKVGIEQELRLTYYAMQTRPDIVEAFAAWLKENATEVTMQDDNLYCVRIYTWNSKESAPNNVLRIAT